MYWIVNTDIFMTTYETLSKIDTLYTFLLLVKHIDVIDPTLQKVLKKYGTSFTLYCFRLYSLKNTQRNSVSVLYFTYLQLILAQTHVISTFVNGRFIPTSSMTGSVPINTFLSTSFHSPIASSVKWNSWEIRKNEKDKWIIWHKQFWSERGPRYLCHI